MTTDNLQPVSIATVWTEEHGAMLVSALASAGIEAHLVGQLTVGLRAEAPSAAEILVHNKDVKDAIRTLDNLKKESAEIQWDNVDLGTMEI